MSNQITIIEDTRESLPLDFTGFRGVDSVRKGLKTGDYSIQNKEDQICFERKSIPDLVQTLIEGHSRFLKEIERMKSFKKAYILIEHTAGTVYRYCARHGWESRFDTIVQSLLAYACHAGVRIRFCKDRQDMASYIVKKSKEFLGEEKNECDAN